MRERKFRAWDSERSEMAEVVSLDTEDCDVRLKDKECGRWTTVYPYIATVMEFTGFKDKNGISVYEGDLIPYHFNEDVKGVVQYGEYRNPCDDIHESHIGFYVYFKDDKYKDTMRKDLGYWLKVSSVCGNIYENK